MEILKESFNDELNTVVESDDEYEKFSQNCHCNATYKKAQAIAEKYGYRIARDCYVEVTESGKKYINFAVMNPDSSTYRPVINYSGYGNNKTFSIQTTAVGSLSVDEHSQYIADITAANKMVRELEQLDLSTLYTIKFRD